MLKVEDTGMGDYVRWAPPYCEGAEDSAKSALYLALNRGKRSIRLNLKEAAGREVLLRLVAAYDVVAEGFRPGVMDRLRGVRGAERAQPEDRLLRDHRLRPHRLRRLRLGSGPRWAMEYTRTGAARRRRRRASASPAPKLEASSPTA